MAIIDSKYIHCVAWSQITEPQLLDNTLTNNVNDFRVLKITDYVNVDKNKSLEMAKDCGRKFTVLRNLLSESSNLFFLIIETTDKYFDKTVFNCSTLRKNCGKSLLIEICDERKTFVRYIFDGKTSVELLNEQLTDYFTFVENSLLLSGLNSLAFDNLKNVSSFMSPLHCILIRLVKLFDVPCAEDVEKMILKNLVLASNVDAFRAFLNLPVIDDGGSIKQTRFTTKVVYYKYELDKTLLFYAANGNINMLKLLLRLGANVHEQNYNSETASDYTEGNYKNLKVLLDNDARFPRNFQQTYANVSNNKDDIPDDEFFEMCVERLKLHQAIVDKNEKIIDLFEKKYPLLKFAYTFIAEEPYSRAATTTALKGAMHSERDDFAMYLYLIDKGFCIDECDLYFMTNADKNKVGAIILNRLKTQQPSHITFLRGKTFMYGVDTNKQIAYKEKLKKIYCALNSVRELESILKTVEHSKSLTVSVDFCNKSVINMDMTASDNVDGLTYHRLGRVYLSVADKDDNEIGGILIHELTHFALHIIFNNNGRPYHKFDTDKESSFDKIVTKIRKILPKLPSSVANVVNMVYTSYSKSSRPKELIARVPQLIALGLSEQNCAEVEEMFTFYRENVLPCMEELTSNPEGFFIKREVNQLNEFLRHVHEIENWNISLCKTCVVEELYYGRKVRKVICDIPRLFVSDFYKETVKKRWIRTSTRDSAERLEECEKIIIFASIEDFVNSTTSTYVQQVWNLTSNITLLLDVQKFVDLNPKFQMDFVKILNNRNTSKNIVVFGRKCDQRILDNIFDANCECFILEYTWNHLKINYKEALLSKEINFQGAMVPLNNLIDNDFRSIPFKELVNEEEIMIAPSVDHFDVETFIDRSFKYCDQIYNTVEVLSLTTPTNQIKSVLLSGYPGSGQSTILSRIALTLKDENHNPDYWVAIINLEQLISASEDTTTDMKLFSKHFVCNKTSVFELSLFRRMYNSSKVILLFDSVVDLPDNCTERALTLLKTLSEKNQLWVTTHKDSPLMHKLEEKLSSKIVLELQPFLRSDHLTYLIKIWQRELHLFDSANRSVFESCAVKVIQFYNVFFGLPKLSAIIANKYLGYVEEYIRNSDEPFIPENVYANNDIYDLHKDLYSEKMQLRYAHDHGSNQVNSDSGDSVVLGINMFTAFKQYADFCLKRSDSTSQSQLLMYTQGKIELLRNGIINYEDELVANRIESYFFLSNYIVQSLELSFEVVYGFLCESIVKRELMLVKFIDGRMKDSTLFHIESTISSFTQLGWDDVMYLLKENAILLLCFILKSLERSDASKREECFTECSLFSMASAKCFRCAIEILWNISNEKFIEYLIQLDTHGYSPFQYAFMNFPESDMDVVRDTTNVLDLVNALRKQETFNEQLNQPIEEKFRKSTLKFYVDKILELNVNEEERNRLIYQYATAPIVFKHNISGKHFEEAMERKWTAMTSLNFPTTDWVALTTTTIFRNVVRIIFNELNSNTVVKFYKWAETKVVDVDAFNKFIADTFVNFFWNCTSEKNGREIIAFIRRKIDIKETLIQRGIEVLNQKFDEKIALFHTLLTENEFESMLFHAIMGKVEINWDLLHALMVFMVGRLDEFRDELLIKRITEFIGTQNRQIISDAICTCTIEGSFFHLALIRRDLFMVKLVWRMAKQYLDEEQFRCQLLDPFNIYPNVVENLTTNEFLHQPPSVYNTNCQTACFEFISFQLNGGVIPEFAVSLNVRNQNYFIGRCKLSNTNGFFLCKIIPNTHDPVEVIECNGTQPLEDSLEIMIGKGMEWTKYNSINDNGQLFFRFNEKLLKRHNDTSTVTLVDCAGVGEHYLAYNDAAAGVSDISTGFHYRRGISLE